MKIMITLTTMVMAKMTMKALMTMPMARTEQLLVSNRQTTFDRQLDPAQLGRFGSQVNLLIIIPMSNALKNKQKGKTRGKFPSDRHPPEFCTNFTEVVSPLEWAVQKKTIGWE